MSNAALNVSLCIATLQRKKHAERVVLRDYILKWVQDITAVKRNTEEMETFSPESNAAFLQCAGPRSDKHLNKPVRFLLVLQKQLSACQYYWR